jgi:putative ABC transport system permease protein
VSALKQAAARLMSFFQRQSLDRELDEEVQAHLDLAVDDYVRRGTPEGDARRLARLKFGAIEASKDAHRDSRGLPWLEGFVLDLRYGVRLLRRRPAIAAVAIVTMALGIGATTMLFSVAYGGLFKPLPWTDAHRLVRLTEMRQGRTGRIAGTVSNGTFLAWAEHPSTIDDIGGWRTQTVTLTGAGESVRVPIVPTTPSLFPILRVQPLIGRLFHHGEGGHGQPGLLILSHSLWQERFGGRAEVVGQSVQLDERPYTVVGVMPREFAFPDRETRAWTAWSVPAVVAENGNLVGVIFRAIARLRDGTMPGQASAEATSRARSAHDMGVAAGALFGAVGPIEVSVVPELEAITAEVRPAILVLVTAVALLLFTATASVASLQLARTTTRRREMAVRAAIGAGRRRIVRQLLIENAVVGLCGGIGGVALAVGLSRLLPSLVPTGFPRLDAISIDLRMMVFALAVSAGASAFCGLLPAWLVRRVSLVDTLSEDGLAPVGGMRSPMARMRGVIMVGQVAIAFVLLVGAVLLSRSLVSLVSAERGYDPVNVLTARLPLPPGYPVDRRSHLLEALVDRLRAAPGVTHAAYSTALPLVSAGGFMAFTMRSPRNPELEVDVQATQRIVSPDYFAAMRLRVVAGRTLSESDTSTAPPAIVVNQTFVRQYLGEHPIGFHIPHSGRRAGGIRFANDQSDWEVVGVVDDMRQDDVDAPLQPEVFASFKQVVPSAITNFDPILVVRTTADPTGHVSMLRRLVREHAPALALDSVMTMEDRVMTSLERPRLYALVLTWFSGFALLIVGVGLFGVLSFSVAQRTREIGVRSALGAQTSDIVPLVLRQVLWIVSIGVAVGLATALVGVQRLSTFLYGISTHDVMTFVAVPVVIVVVAAAACLVPARRAAQVDPLTALRSG